MSQQVNVYDIGDDVRLSVSFTVDGVPTDPTTITLRLRHPNLTTESHTLASGEIVRDSAGVFHRVVSPDAYGPWHWRWEGTGAARAAVEGYFEVRRSVFL